MEVKLKGIIILCLKELCASPIVKAAQITHDLLRYAYRRTGAIVVEDGRRGVDLIVPARLKKLKRGAVS